MDLPWLSHKLWAVRRYGHPVFRVPVDPGWGCPNRDPEGRGGCTFCAEDGGRARQIGGAVSLNEQAERGMRFARERYGAAHLQLYVQAYTATYADVNRLRGTLGPLVESGAFDSLCLGTRPDCLSNATLGLLSAWNETREVWVELGIQTAQDVTLSRIRRGHDWARSAEAVRVLDQAGLRPCAHLIFGLPGEGPDEMMATLRAVVALPVHGLKLHNLHVLRNSPMGLAWRDTPFPVLGEREYLELLAGMLRWVPAELPLFRLVTDSPPGDRLAPPRVMAKGQFLHELAATMRARGWRQGDRCGTASRA